MDKKSLIFCRCLTGLLFMIPFVDKAVFAVSENLLQNQEYLLPLIGFILMAISMFSGVYELLAVGAGVQAIPYLIILVKWLGKTGSKDYFTAIYYFIFFVGNALVIYFVFKRQSAAKIGVLVSILFLVGMIVNGHYYIERWGIYYYYEVYLFDFFFNNCLPIILSGLVLTNTPKRHLAKEIPTSKEADTSNSQIDNLVRLKELLDAGAITQEEFNEKKKQILGL